MSFCKVFDKIVVFLFSYLFFKMHILHKSCADLVQILVCLDNKHFSSAPDGNFRFVGFKTAMAFKNSDR